MLGGGMRQAGILAAAGLYALDHHLDRLVDDHRHATQLAKKLATLSMFDFNPESVETNLIYARLSMDALSEVGDAYVWQDRFEEQGILCYAESDNTIRFVTHLDISDSMIEEAIKRIQSMR